MAASISDGVFEDFAGQDVDALLAEVGRDVFGGAATVAGCLPAALDEQSFDAARVQAFADLVFEGAFEDPPFEAVRGGVSVAGDFAAHDEFVRVEAGRQEAVGAMLFDEGADLFEGADFFAVARRGAAGFAQPGLAASGGGVPGLGGAPAGDAPEGGEVSGSGDESKAPDHALDLAVGALWQVVGGELVDEVAHALAHEWLGLGERFEKGDAGFAVGVHGGRGDGADEVAGRVEVVERFDAAHACARVNGDVRDAQFLAGGVFGVGVLHHLLEGVFAAGEENQFPVGGRADDEAFGLPRWGGAMVSGALFVSLAGVVSGIFERC